MKRGCAINHMVMYFCILGTSNTLFAILSGAISLSLQVVGGWTNFSLLPLVPKKIPCWAKKVVEDINFLKPSFAKRPFRISEQYFTFPPAPKSSPVPFLCSCECGRVCQSSAIVLPFFYVYPCLLVSWKNNFFWPNGSLVLRAAVLPSTGLILRFYSWKPTWKDGFYFYPKSSWNIIYPAP